MDAIILSLAIKLFKKLKSFIYDYQSDTFGTAKSGNYYIGNNKENVPVGYKYIEVQEGDTYKLPVSILPHFENLIIADGANLSSVVPYLFLYVRDTLTIKPGSSLHMNANGNNSYTFSQFLPKPSAGKGESIKPYTASCLKLFLSGRDVKTVMDLYACGGDKNKSALSSGGTVAGGGGLVSIYHKTGEFVTYNTASNTKTSVEPSYVMANGGKTGETGGGMLFIFAKKIVLEYDPSTQKYGVISANGGDGEGPTSYLDGVPAINTDTKLGGAGLVSRVQLDVA